MKAKTTPALTLGLALCVDPEPPCEAVAREYRVTWTIDVWATDPEHAARLARDAQVRPGTIATVFDVTDKAKRGRGIKTVRVDLTALDNARAILAAKIHATVEAGDAVPAYHDVIGAARELMESGSLICDCQEASEPTPGCGCTEDTSCQDHWEYECLGCALEKAFWELKKQVPA